MKYFLSFLAIALAALAWYKPDETSLGFNWMFWLVALVTFMAQVVQTYRDAKSQRGLENNIKSLKEELDKKPKLQLSLNDNLIRPNETVELLRSEEGRYPLVFKLKNVGSATAKRIQVQFQFPGILNEIYLGNKWIDHGAIENVEVPSLKKSFPLRQFSFVAPVDVHPQNFLSLGNGYSTGFKVNAESLLVKVRVSYENMPDIVFNITLGMSK